MQVKRYSYEPKESIGMAADRDDHHGCSPLPGGGTRDYQAGRPAPPGEPVSNKGGNPMKMRLNTGLATAFAFAGGLLFSTTIPAGQPPAWEQIFFLNDHPIEVTLADQTKHTVVPSCSGGPVMTAAGPVPGDTQYSFFIQLRNPNKLIVVFDGGGACWNEATCIGSVLAGSPTYSPVVDETPESLAAGRGLLDVTNPENPFKEYTKVFVPYCTADVHWGSRDTEYALPLPSGGALSWTIHHRGSDNLIAVLDWLQRNGRSRQIDLGRVHDLTVAGLSAGAYGTLNGFAFFAQATPRARHNLIADAGIGVLAEPFYTRALYNPADESSESWGASKNLPTWVPGFDTMLAHASADPRLLVPLAFQALAEWQPEAHFASLTAQLDATQIFFYSAMKDNFTPGSQEAGEWYAGMKLITSMTAAQSNYRYFIDAGTFHTFLGNDARTYDVGANGISVADWIWEMIKPGNRTWENLEAPPPF